VLTLEAYSLEGEYHGRYRSWWDNGVLKEEGTYISGQRVGIYRWYKDTGELWEEHDYGRAL
jgi:antitoxin component YwqK of YwqJK toxin-antitoxin module